MYIKKIYIFFELWLTEAFGVIVEVPGLPIQPYSLIKMYYDEVKKIRQQEIPIFLRFSIDRAKMAFSRRNDW